MKSSKPARNVQMLIIEIKLKQIVQPNFTDFTDISRWTVNKILQLIKSCLNLILKYLDIDVLIN